MPSATAADKLEREGFTTIPTTGEEFRFLVSDEDLARIDWWLPPGGRSPAHLHPRQVERVTGLAGELTIRYVDGQVREFKVIEGTSLSVPAGVAHEFHNAGLESAHMIVDFIPALRIKEFFETVAGLASDGHTNDAGRPKRPLLAAALVHEFRDEFAVTSPPRWLQSLIVAPLARLATARRVVAQRTGYQIAPVEPDFEARQLVGSSRPLVDR